MDLSPQHKIDIEKKVVEAIATALENDILTTEEMPEVSSFILDRSAAISTHDQMLEFLRELSAKWPFFSNILVLESGEVQHKSEEKTSLDVVELTKAGKIEEALSLAKSANEQSKIQATETIAQVSTQAINTQNTTNTATLSNPVIRRT